MANRPGGSLPRRLSPAPFLSVKQFATVVGMSEKTVLRHIHARGSAPSD